MRYISVRLAVGVLASGCGKATIAWDDPAPLSRAIGARDDIVVGSDGAVRVVLGSDVEMPLARIEAGACPESVRFARDTTGEWYAVW